MSQVFGFGTFSRDIITNGTAISVSHLTNKPLKPHAHMPYARVWKLVENEGKVFCGTQGMCDDIVVQLIHPANG